MFTVTATALEQLDAALDRIDQSKPDSACFRIVPDVDNKLALKIDAPEANDTEYECEGHTVLVLSDDMRERCSRRVLDSDGVGNLVLT